MSETAVSSELKGTVAIVGYPNVGKSTLVNRLTATRAAVVHETPGVTRDRKELLCDWAGERFLLVDTGGVDITDDSPITRGAVAQARAAIEEADLVLLLVDARAGLTPGDAELTDILRRARKPVLLVANKLDDPSRPELSHEFATLGFGEPVEISALHGHGTGDLLDAVLERLPGGRGQPVSDEAIRVAVLGRPNVGKSSLLNALLGQERLIVSDVPGTTRDAIDTVLETDDRTFVLVDTAGMRRKRKHRQGIEYYSELRALEAANQADVALVLVDASEGVVEQDLTVADVARKAQCSTFVVLSKWDQTTVEIEDVRARLESRLRQRPPIVTTSAKTGRGIARLLERVATLFDKHASRLGTPELNRFLAELREDRQPPSRRRKRLNLLYGTQTSVRPPRYRFFVNDPSLVTRDYAYWVENRMRER
ncbi:MAG: ribosome biogenesis GTPase Der, partial [Gaiellaceae bacterium]